MITSEYTKDFQIALITNIFHSVELMKYVRDRLKIEDFDLTGCKLVYEILLDYFDKFKKCPGMDILTLEVEKRLNMPESSKVQVLPEEFESLGIILERIYQGGGLDHDYFRANIPGYLKHVRGIRAVADHVQRKTGNVDELVEQMVNIHVMTNNGNDDLKIINASQELYPVLSEEDLRKIGFGISELEKRTAQGLRTGGLGMVTACSGVGKTNTLLNFARGAVWQGYRCLFFTLELSRSRIIHRYTAMTGCIRAGLFEMPMRNWPDDELELYSFVTSPSFKHYGKLDVIDMSARSTYTVEAIDRYIDEWLANTAKMYGSDEVKKCKAIYVDWLDKIQPSPRHKYMKSYEYLPKFLEELGNIARRYDVALWTATQATRDADGAAQVKQKHTSYSFHKNDFLDIGIGVSPVATPIQQLPQDLGISFKADAGRATSLVDCNKSLNYNINKNRDSEVGDVMLYMGPSLRLFNKQQEWLSIREHIRQHNFEILGV